MTRESVKRSGNGNREVIELLNKLGDRLIQNERERESIKSTITSLSFQMDGFEDRNEAYDANAIKLQSQVQAALANESRLTARQDELEAKLEENLERIEKAADLADKIEEAMAMQARTFRRLDKMNKDRSLLIRKIDSIEDQVSQTQNELQKNTLMLVNQNRDMTAPDTASKSGKTKGQIKQDRTSFMLAATVTLFFIATMFGGVSLFKSMNKDNAFTLASLQSLMNMNKVPDEAEFVFEDSVSSAASSAEFKPVPPAYTDTGYDAAYIDTEVPDAEIQQGQSNTFDTWLSDFADEQNMAPTDDSQTQDAETVVTSKQDEPQKENTGDVEQATSLADTFPYNMESVAKTNTSRATKKEVTLSESDKDLVAGLDTEPKPIAKQLNEIKPASGHGPQDLTATIQLGKKADAKLAEGLGLAVENDPKVNAPSRSSKVAFMEDASRNADLVEQFINAQKGSGPLNSRISKDPSLPGAIQEIEAKAFESIPEAQHDLAAIYTAGHAGVEINYTKAAQWFNEAAINGVANARYNLGVLYHQGLGVEQNMSKALGWYKAAARKNHPEALYNLGIAHLEGIGTKYSPHLAAGYFERAADKDVLEAAYNLGLIHENGLLGSASFDDALVWYQKAASLGSPDALTALDELGQRIGMDQEHILDMKEEALETFKEYKTRHAEMNNAAPVDLYTPSQKSMNDITPAAGHQIQKKTNAQSMIKNIQSSLMDLGLYPGPANGSHSLVLEDAIRAYQRQNNLAPTGQPTSELLSHLVSQ